MLGDDFALGTCVLFESQRRSNTERAFDTIQAYIDAGDCYQVNLAQRASRAEYSGDPWQAYRELRAVAAAPFSAYLSLAGRRHIDVPVARAVFIAARTPC